MKIKYLLPLSCILAFSLMSCSTNNNVSTTTNNSTLVESTTTSNNISTINTIDKYNIKWLNYDGSVLETDIDVSSIAIPSYDSNEPEKPSDTEGFYKFTGWILSSSKNTEKNYVATYVKNKYPYLKYNDKEYSLSIEPEAGATDFLGKQVVLSEQYNNLPITHIDVRSNSSLKSIVCSKNIIDIQLRYCMSLEQVLINDNTDFSKMSMNIIDCENLQFNEYDNAYYLGSEKNKYLCLVDVKSKDITSVKINENCKYIRNLVFYQCKQITEFDFPNALYTLSYDFICDNSSVTTVKLPNSLKKITNYAIYGCSSLSSIYYKGTIEEWNNIEKETYWCVNCPATKVICTDGEVDI